MKAKVTSIEKGRGWSCYDLNIEDGIWSPADGDYIASVGMDNMVEVIVALRQGYTLEEIEAILDQVEAGETVTVKGISIELETPGLERRETGGIEDILETYSECGYVYDEEGNAVEVDAPNSPLVKMGLV